MKFSLDTNYIIALLHPKDRLAEVSTKIIERNKSTALLLLFHVIEEYALKYSNDFDKCANNIANAISDASGNKRNVTEIIQSLSGLKETDSTGSNSVFYSIILTDYANVLIKGDKLAIAQCLSKIKILLVAGIPRQLKRNLNDCQIIDSPFKQDVTFREKFSKIMKNISNLTNQFKDASDQRIFSEAATYCMIVDDPLTLFTDDAEFRKSAKVAISELEMHGLKRFKVADK